MKVNCRLNCRGISLGEEDPKWVCHTDWALYQVTLIIIKDLKRDLWGGFQSAAISWGRIAIYLFSFYPTLFQQVFKGTSQIIKNKIKIILKHWHINLKLVLNQWIISEGHFYINTLVLIPESCFRFGRNAWIKDLSTIL